MLSSLYKVWIFPHDSYIWELSYTVDKRFSDWGLVEIWITVFFSLISVAEIFPPVVFNFAGSASMFLRPIDYLIHMGFLVSTPLVDIIFSVSVFCDITLKE